MLINCDLGECLTPDPDVQVMPLIDMANIACGGHVGNVASMTKTILLAKQHGVRIGAHPSYFDREHFGRVSLNLRPSDLYTSLRQQLTAFSTICENQAVQPQYIKPHGALYHDMMREPAVFDVICDVIQSINPSLALIVQAGVNTAQLSKVAAQRKIQLFYEAFADRAYRGAALVPRTEAGAMLSDVDTILAQVKQFKTDPPFEVDTVCFHSDHPPSITALTKRAT